MAAFIICVITALILLSAIIYSLYDKTLFKKTKKFFIFSNNQKIYMLEYDNLGLFKPNINFYNIKDNKGRTTLHYAVANGDRNIVTWLLYSISSNNKSILTLKDNEGKTALHYAVANRDHSFIKLVLQYYDTENLIVQDNNGKTPLHYAAENGTFSFIKQVTNFPDSYEYVEDNNGKKVSEHPEIGKHSESYTKQVKEFFASSELPNIGGNDDNDLSFTI